MSTQKIALQSLNIINDLSTLSGMSDKQEKTISVRIDAEMMHTLNERSKHYRISRANLIRRLIQEGLGADLQLGTNVKYLDIKIESLSREMQAMREELAKYVHPETTSDQLPAHQKGGKKKSSVG